jgi:hypothetical protein
MHVFCFGHRAADLTTFHRLPDHTAGWVQRFRDAIRSVIDLIDAFQGVCG